MFRSRLGQQCGSEQHPGSYRHQQCQLPAVSWVIPTGQASDHPGNNNGTGPSWVASIVNAIGGSSYWSNTAVIITWDDWGGWYDHVPPPKVIADRTSWGSGLCLRVPRAIDH